MSMMNVKTHVGTPSTVTSLKASEVLLLLLTAGALINLPSLQGQTTS